MDYGRLFGAEFREVQDGRQREGKPVRVVVASRTYSTDREDLWDALTNAERIPRWFLPIEGELELGGRYQLEGHAGGQITRCDQPEALEVTWESGGNVSWVAVRLEPDGEATRLTLEHMMLKDEAGEEHWRQYGPGATGVGWELAILGLAHFCESGGQVFDLAAFTTWMGSDEGKVFVRASAEAWGEAHSSSGEAPDVARAMAARTADFYAGA